MTDLEGNILNAFKEKPMISWRYIDNIFFIWEHGEESMEKFLNKLSSFHSQEHSRKGLPERKKLKLSSPN